MSGEDNGTYDYSSYYDTVENKGSFQSPCEDFGVSNFGRVFLPTLYSVVFILGFIGNGLVVCVLLKQRNKTNFNLTDICLLNLALSDILFVITLPFYSHFAVVSEWKFGDFMCRFTSVSHNIGFFSSIFFMVVMTLDRYMVIMYAFKVAQYHTVRAGIALTILVWMLSLSVSLPTLIFTKVSNESHGLICAYLPENEAWKHYNLLTTSLLGLVIPLAVMVTCYARIIPILVNLRSAKRHRTVKLIVSIVAVFFIFWAPYNISLFLDFLKKQDKLQGDKCYLDGSIRLAITVTEAFAYSHCCLNPIIYAFVSQRFTKQAVQTLRSCVPGIPFLSSRELSNSSYRKSSIMSRSSEVTPTFIR